MDKIETDLNYPFQDRIPTETDSTARSIVADCISCRGQLELVIRQAQVRPAMTVAAEF